MTIFVVIALSVVVLTSIVASIIVSRRKAGQAQRAAKQRPKATGKARVPPGERGGAPRGSKGKGEKPAGEPKGLFRKPEIICCKREWQWIPMVELPEKILEDGAPAVLQNGRNLTRDESREGCWHLDEIRGQVIVIGREADDEEKIEIARPGDNCLLFKLSGQNLGHCVKCSSSGSYLAIVPDDWRRDEASCGPPPVAPESVSLTGYKAHFFSIERDGGQKIAFVAPGDKRVVVESKKSGFELAGNQLHDAMEDVGPLFGGGPPLIRAQDNQDGRILKP